MKKVILLLTTLTCMVSAAQVAMHTSVPTTVDSDAIGTTMPPTQLITDADFMVTLSGLVIGENYRLFNQLRNSTNVQFAGFARNPFTATAETMVFNITELGWGFFGGGVLTDEETATWFTQLTTDETPAVTLSQIQSDFLVDDPDTDGSSGGDSGLLNAPVAIGIMSPFTLDYTVSGSLLKKVTIEADADGPYANFGMSVGNSILIDHVDITSGIPQSLNFIVNFPASGNTSINIFVRSNDITLNSITIEDTAAIDFPTFVNANTDADLNEPDSIKYGGPSIADIDNDGDYDFILNNHNAHEFAPNVLYLNNGDGTVTRSQELSQFILHDLHGSAAADYDNDGDLDIAIANGGGNGANPTPPIIYTNNNGSYTESSAEEIGVTLLGRGRSPRWVDFDLDGDLDLAFFNATPLDPNTTRHVFYVNNGDEATPRFTPIAVPGLEDATAERVLITDLNNDHIDDVLMTGPLTVWKGNGDYSFTDMSADWLPASSPFVGQIRNRFNNLAATHLDIDNDGDLDLYIAGGLGVFAIADRNSLDFEPETTILDARTSGSDGTLTIDFKADGDLRFYDFDVLRKGGFAGEYPIFLGSAKARNTVETIENDVLAADDPGRQLVISQSNAAGFPDDVDRTENGIYIGYLGNDNWKFETVRNGDIFFNLTFSLEGVSELVSTSPALGNRNIQDVLLRNDISTGGGLVDVSEAWNIPKGGTHTGAITGDFNNDGLQDLLVHRYAYIRSRRSDYLLLNTGNGFEVSTDHDANSRGTISHGDMGQAFDFDNDGDVDILNGDDEFGSWYLYRNENTNSGNFATVKVGYSPVSNIDPISAEVTVTTTNGTQYKRVASGGAVFSQSLLNIVHFGLGDASVIDRINVRWRNGEEAEFTNETVNQIFNTDEISPTSIEVTPNVIEVRAGATSIADLTVTPIFANRDVIWSSDDETIATVDQNGVVTGVLEGGTTTINARSMNDNSIVGSATVNVVAFVPINATSVTLDVETVTIVEGNTRLLNATVLPVDADDKALTWTSSDEAVATVNTNGVVSAIADGTSTVTVALTADPSIKDEVTINVARFTAASITFDDRNIYTNTAYSVNGNVDVSVNYHAGTGNTIVATPNQGIRFFLRHLDKDFNVISDIVIDDQSVIGTESGISSVAIPLNGLTPSASLTNDEFYFLLAQFTNSRGETETVSTSPINIVDQTLSVNDLDLTNEEVTMFPNPASAYISFTGIENLNCVVTISSLSGVKLLSQQIKGKEPISIVSLSSGFYIVSIEIEGESSKKVFSLIKGDTN